MVLTGITWRFLAYALYRNNESSWRFLGGYVGAALSGELVDPLLLALTLQSHVE